MCQTLEFMMTITRYISCYQGVYNLVRAINQGIPLINVQFKTDLSALKARNAGLPRCFYKGTWFRLGSERVSLRKCHRSEVKGMNRSQLVIEKMHSPGESPGRRIWGLPARQCGGSQCSWRTGKAERRQRWGWRWLLTVIDPVHTKQAGPIWGHLTPNPCLQFPCECRLQIHSGASAQGCVVPLPLLAFFALLPASGNFPCEPRAVCAVAGRMGLGPSVDLCEGRCPVRFPMLVGPQALVSVSLPQETVKNKIHLVCPFQQQPSG